MYNKVILMGRITKDLELKTTPAGVSVLSFSIAVDRKYQQKGEEKKTDFFNCVAWRNEAEFISRFFHKGSAILIEGELQNRSYKDKNGADKWVTEIIVDRACFTGEKKDKYLEAKANDEHSAQEALNSLSPDELRGESASGDDYPF